MRYVFLFLFSSFVLMAGEEQVLSTTKQEIIKLQQKQAQEKEQVNKYDWLSDVTASGSVSKDDSSTQTEDYSLTISQDIFRFGGISSQIEYAKELKKMTLLGIDKDTKSDLSTLYSTLVDIKLNDISLKQNILNTQNAIIDVKHKTSEYEQGEIGISDLNDAIMTRNELQDTNKQLKLSKLTNMNTIKQYTDKEYENILIPAVKLVSKELFVENVLAVKYAKSTSKVDDYLYKIKKTDYLPSISVDGSVGYKKEQHVGDDYYSYGLSISMPLSYTSSNDIEQTRLEYLISEQELNDEKRNASVNYDSVLLKIKNYEERISLAKDDIKLYAQLLKMNQEEYEAGYKTQDDVQTIKNSMDVRELDIKSYELYIQQQILSLYFQM